MDREEKNDFIERSPGDFVHFLLPDEGELSLIYGRIGQGKTTYAVSEILKDLSRGQVVYTTFPVNFKGIDERKSLFNVFFKKNFFVFPPENLRYLDPYSNDIWDQLYELDNCKIYFDDCIVHLFDSYEKTLYAKKKRQWAFETRHYDRSIILITQRPNQVQVALRSQVNRFFKCTRVFKWPFLYFKIYEYQDMIGESVDETESTATIRFIGRKHILEAFDTKYLRQGRFSIKPQFRVFNASLSGRWRIVLASVMKAFLMFSLKRKHKKFLKNLKIPVKSDRAPRGVKLNRVALKDRWQGGPEQTSIGSEARAKKQDELPF